MVDLVTAALSGITFVFAMVASYLSYQIYRQHHGEIAEGWKYMLAAFGLLFFQRVLGLISVAKLIPEADYSYINNAALIIFLAIITLITLGLWRIRNTFRDYELVEKTTMERIGEFERRQMRKMGSANTKAGLRKKRRG